jgi:alpha-L-fucosidase 2
MPRLRLGLALCCATLLHAAPRDDAPTDLALRYDRPAGQWIEALPVGNGRLGAMVFGGVSKETLQLNDITLWSGGPQPGANRADAHLRLPELRRLLREGRHDEAEKLANRAFNAGANYDLNKYQTLGELVLDFSLPDAVPENYARTLDLDRAVASASFTLAGVAHRREVFASAPDQVLVQRLSADRPGSINFTLSLARDDRARVRFVAPGTLVMTGDTGRHLDYEVHARVLPRGGRITGSEDTLSVAGADEVVILLSARTSYVMDFARGYRGADPALAAADLRAASAKPREQLLADHLADHRRYFRRVSLDLRGADPASPPPPATTDARLLAYGDGRADPGLASLFFQYGRYLLVSASRPDSPVPANLQGLWADTYNTPWNGDYTININLQMNYWPAEPTGLSEMHEPMLRHIRSLAEPGALTARAYFGPDTPGWVSAAKSNVWGWTSPGRVLPWGIWFGSNGWLCQHLWERYAFTGDLDGLRDAYPVMKGAAEFWLANLVETADGHLVASPSSSPENTFTTDDGVKGSLVEGGTMDHSIIRELFGNTAAAAALLDLDPDFRAALAAARARIRPPQIGRRGQLMEWNGDWDSPDDKHRHVSHLYGLHPGHEITLHGTPVLAAAARRSLEMRGDAGTGWSIAWKINFWARLRDGDRAHRLLSTQLTHTGQTRMSVHGGGTYPNLFCAHPPFQIDGNFGATAGIAEMLLQSHERHPDPENPAIERHYLDLLPALPSAWPAGSVTGLRARGGVTIDLAWNDGRLTTARLTAKRDVSCLVRYEGRIIPVTLAAGTTETIRIP